MGFWRRRLPPEVPERLQKVMAHAGIASRRQCEHLIEAGRVKVNGQFVRELGTKVDPDHDVIEVDGQRVKPERHTCILFHKPKGCLTTVTDPFGRRTVMDYIQGVNQRVYPVGRLDFDTSGLLLLTNDGNLSYRLTHPGFGVEKEYWVNVEGVPSEETLEQLRKGVVLEDGRTAPAKVRLLSKGKKQSRLSLIIHEGRKRQIKRMCQAVGHPVCSLHRVRFGPIHLGNLPPGKYRQLSPDELSALKRAVACSHRR